MSGAAAARSRSAVSASRTTSPVPGSDAVRCLGASIQHRARPFVRELELHLLAAGVADREGWSRVAKCQERSSSSRRSRFAMESAASREGARSRSPAESSVSARDDQPAITAFPGREQRFAV